MERGAGLLGWVIEERVPLQYTCRGRFNRALWGGHVSFFPSWASATLVAEVFFFIKNYMEIACEFF
jgi:hypothetical protein